MQQQQPQQPQQLLQQQSIHQYRQQEQSAQPQQLDPHVSLTLHSRIRLLTHNDSRLHEQEWHKGFNFDAKRGMLRAALHMQSAYDNSEHEILRISLMISQQESQFGVNMYDALLPTDEADVSTLVRKGLTLDEAVLRIFESRFGKTRPISPVCVLLQ
jgi:hypothetical protein